MTRNWGIPPRDDARFRRARDAKPLLTLGVTMVFGVIGAALAAISFTDARDVIEGLFRGSSLAAAIVAAGAGCWGYLFFAWRRLAAQFAGGDAFSDLLQFYIRATIGLVLLVLGANLAKAVGGPIVGGLVLCLAGGAASAAAFQTVMTFVPPAPPTDKR